MKSDLMDLAHGDPLDMWEAAKRIASDGDLTLVPELLDLLTSAPPLDRQSPPALRWVR